MYEKIKKIIPRSLLLRNETLLRRIISLAYLGNKYNCNICNFKMKKFIVLENQDKLCPRCGSISRTRRLWTILENIISGKRILHFSPSKSIRSKLESVPEVEYITTDYVGEFDAIKSLNIESIDEPDNHYDIIICSVWI